MPTELTPRDLWLINCYEREQLESDDVYVFTIKLCDNDVDRDGERFTLKSLNILKDMFVGQAGIVDHSPKNKNVTARILECDVKQVPTRTTATGECYYYLTARAYVKRSAESEKLISSIESGELSEVSVGCAVSATVCNICGEEIQVCPHTKGNYYNGQLCCGELISPYEAYEWSFVAKPKALSESKPITPEAAIIRLNQIRTATGERPPEIDMAIRAINLNMVKRKPVPSNINGICYRLSCRVCPVCGSQWIEDFCANCGQALDWTGGDSDGRNKQ